MSFEFVDQPVLSQPQPEPPVIVSEHVSALLPVPADTEGPGRPELESLFKPDDDQQIHLDDTSDLSFTTSTTNSDDDDPIVVVGDDPDDDYDWRDYRDPDGGSGGGGGGSYGGGGGTIGEPSDEMSCVEESPAGADLSEMNDMALDLASDIASQNDEVYEYGAIIYELNGNLYNTGVFTQGSSQYIDWNEGIALIPDGATIVGIVHNHPDEPNDDRYPSDQDWDSYDSFMSLNTRGITADPNMLMYIYTNEDKQTRVYDRTDKNTENASCTI